MIATSTPSLTEFDPKLIPFQFDLIKDLRTKYDYGKGLHEILLSGSVGSAKSIIMAHAVLTHCILNKGAVVGLGRLSMPALKGTIFSTILNHIGNDLPAAVNESQAIIKFPNGSIIRSFSWQDKKYKKVRSYEFSAFAIEELTENENLNFYHEIVMRVGRLTHVKEKWVMSATNPDDPTHEAYKYFITSQDHRRHVYYSKTEDNPFLPPSYINDLKKNLDPKMARRMLYGEWLSITQDVIYHAYSEQNETKGDYELNTDYPVYWSFDFNIGAGKPMSSIFFQFIDDKMICFDELVIEGARTQDVCDEAEARGLIKQGFRYIITGDSTGKAKDTRSNRSDYEIIEKFMANHKFHPNFMMRVPNVNPPIRTRHNTVNAYLKNALGQNRLFFYDKCKTARDGMRLSKLKKGGDYVEDDSKREQHITTAIGYGLNCAVYLGERKLPSTTAR